MADYRIWPATSGPVSSSSDVPINVATEFYVVQPCWAKAILLWRADTNMADPIIGRLWTVDDAVSGSPVPGTDVTFTLSGTGWQTATFSSPVLLTANQRYRTSIVSQGFISATGGYWNPGGPGENGFSYGPLRAPSNGSNPDQSGEQGSFTTGSTYVYPNTNFQGGNYWIDVLITDVDPNSSPVKRAAFMSFFE